MSILHKPVIGLNRILVALGLFVIRKDPEALEQTAEMVSQKAGLARIAADCRPVACYLFLPNLPFWLAGLRFPTVGRAVFNADYLLVGLMSVFVPNLASFLALCLVLLSDAVGATSALYYFSPSDLFSSARYVLELPVRRVVSWGCTIAISVVLMAFLIGKLAGDARCYGRARVVSLFMGAILILLVLGAETGAGSVVKHDSFVIPKLANSSSWVLVRSLWGTISPNVGVATPAHVDSATFDWLRHGASSKGSNRTEGNNFVLVVVESYGAMKDTGAAARLNTPFWEPSILARYLVREGRVRFRGGTVSGEFRELCGLDISVSSRDVAHRVASGCLPRLFKERGYSTIGIHGFDGYMFNRRSWYRTLGFDQTLFVQDLRTNSNMRICGGAFNGICDGDVVPFLRQQLLSNPSSPKFIHWVTLNSHIPVQTTKATSQIFSCNSSNPGNTDHAICNWMGLIYTVNSAVAKLAADRAMRKTEFIVVGDHAPAFVEEKRRNQFSQTEVPYIRLVPR